MDYLDFDIEIGAGSGREYPVAVIRSAAGEARETMQFPFDELALENQLLALQNALLRSGGRRRQILSHDEQVVQNFGRALFEALFTGEVRTRYALSKGEAFHQGKGLRLKLRIQSPELATLPWEFLYDVGQAEYICLSSNTPIVRYLELPQPPRPLSVGLPLRILGMIASPKDLAELDVEREKQRVEKAIQHLHAKGMVELTWLPGQTWQELQRILRHGPWHIFHFIGHGGFDPRTDEGLIALEDDEGRAQYLSATRLGRLLADHRPLRLVVLNSCEGARGSEKDIFSSTASILVRRGIQAVLAMQYEITDRAAIELSRAFYEALADGLPVDMAVSEARKSVSLGVVNTVEWGTPVLYMRSPDGVLFDLIQKPAIQEEQPEQPTSVNASTTNIPPIVTPVQRPHPLPEPSFSTKTTKAKKSVEFLICYAHEDELLLNKLKTHLRLLQRQGLIEVWYDRDISAGTEWEQEIKEHLNSAQIVLLLVSPDFMDSDYCYSIEMKRALERHERGEARVIPVILRHVYWQGAPFGKLQALPKDAKPVVDSFWHSSDEAFFNVAEGIRSTVDILIARQIEEEQTHQTEEERISKVVKHLPSPSAFTSPALQSDSISYVDFTLRIGADGTIWSSSPYAGQRKASIAIAVPEDIQLRSRLIEADATDEALLKDFGIKLYQMIFPPDIDKHFNSTEAAARSHGRRVRIRLSIEPDTLAVLPWEFLYRKEGGYFLAVNPDTVLARYLDLPLPPDLPGKREGSLHLLSIIANPSDQSPLDPDEWESIILQALRVPLQQGLLTVQTIKQATYEHIRDALLQHQPDIIQFVGHGIYRDGKGYLALVKSTTNTTWEIDANSFANIFQGMGLGNTLRLFSLATCESAKSNSSRGFLGIAPQIVQRGMPIVVAMQYSIPIDIAEIYLENFYTAVAAGRPVDWAVQHARNAISIKKGLNNREFATPVLYMRATDGNLF